jgi:hypothetical protein
LTTTVDRMRILLYSDTIDLYSYFSPNLDKSREGESFTLD